MPLRPDGVGGGGGSMAISFNGQVVETSASTLNFTTSNNEISVDSNGQGTVNVRHPAMAFPSHFNTTDGNTTGTVTGEQLVQRRIAADMGGALNWGDTLQPASRSASIDYAPTGFVRYPDNINYGIRVEYNSAATLADPSTVVVDSAAITANGAYPIGSVGSVSVSSEQSVGEERKANFIVTIDHSGILGTSGILTLGISLVNLTTGAVSGTRYETQYFWDGSSRPAVAFAVGPNMVTPVYRQTSGISHLTIGTVWDGQWSVGRIFETTGAEAPAVSDLTAYGISKTSWSHTEFDKNSSNSSNQTVADSKETCDMPVALCSYDARAAVEVYDWGYVKTSTSAWGWSLLYNGIPTSTDLVETFGDEGFRHNANLSPYNSSLWIANTDAIVSCGKLHNQGEDYGSLYWYPESDIVDQPDYSTGRSTTAQYVRRFPDGNLARQNARLDFTGTAEPTTIEFSLDGTDWYDLQSPFLGGSLVNGAGAVTAGSWPNITFTTGTIFTTGNLYLRLGITAPQEVSRIELTWT